MVTILQIFSTTSVVLKVKHAVSSSSNINYAPMLPFHNSMKPVCSNLKNQFLLN